MNIAALEPRWDLIILFLIVLSILIIPFQFAFQQKVTLIGSIIVYVMDLFFISEGQVDIIDESGALNYSTMTGGGYFGDLSILLGEKRTASAKANGFCETFILDSEDFFQIKKEYPEFTEVLKKVSSKKTEKTTQLLLDGVIL